MKAHRASKLAAGLIVVGAAAGAGLASSAASSGPGVPDRIGPSGVRCMDVTGDPGDLVVVNLTPVRASGLGYGWLSSSGDEAAGVSNVNYRVGSIDPNVAVATIGADGQVCFHNGPLASVHLVADQLATVSADVISAATPQRLIDTRAG